MSLLDIKIITNKYIYMEQMVEPEKKNPGQEKIDEINNTLQNYTTVLAKCIASKTKSHTITKNKLDTIAGLIEKIKEKINTTKNNVAELENSRAEWEANLKKRTEADNLKLKKQIEDEQKIEASLKDKMRVQGEQNAKLMNDAKDQQDQLKAKLDDYARKKDVDDENHRKELEKINTKQLEANQEHDAQIEAANAERQKALDQIKEQEDKRKNELQTEKEARQKQDEDYRSQLAKLGEDKDAAANLLKDQINVLKEQIEKLTNEKVVELENHKKQLEQMTNEYGQKEETHIAEKKRLQEELEAEKKSHLEEVKALKEEHANQMEEIRKGHEKFSAIQREAQTTADTEKAELNKALATCQATKKGYEDVMENNQTKIKQLMGKYQDNENIVLDEIITLLKSVGVETEQLKSLTNVVPSSSSPLARQESVDLNRKTVDAADRVLHQSKSFNDGKMSAGEIIQQTKYDEEEAEEAGRKKLEEERFQKEYIDKTPGKGEVREAWGDKNPSTQELKKMVSEASKSAHHDIFFKKSGGLQRNHKIEKGLHIPIDEYINKHSPQELHQKILNNPGFESKRLAHTYTTAMKAVDWKKHNINGAFNRILKNIIKTHSILIKGVVGAVKKGKDLENIFEDLLTAFYIIHSSQQIHSFLIDNTKYDDFVLEEGGKHAGHLWAGGEGYLGELNAEIDKNEGMPYRIYIKNNDSTLNSSFSRSNGSGNAAKAHTSWKNMRQYGGFRHGKRSQKKNKRTLKSKLTAKKYSLKVGKKKKGKRGNKSKKRRKSIKIRI